MDDVDVLARTEVDLALPDGIPMGVRKLLCDVCGPWPETLPGKPM